MTIIITHEQIHWTQLFPSPDPQHGSPCSRSSHGLSVVQNGTRLIVLGGEHVARTPLTQDHWAADLVEEGQWQWRLLLKNDTDNGPPDRIAHAQAAVGNAVYVFGGRAGVTMKEKAMNDLWKLDCSGPPGTEQWIQMTNTTDVQGTPPEPRSFHRMIANGNSLFVFGGCGASGRLADLHRFDLDTNTWYDMGASPLLRGRGGPNLLSLNGGKTIGVVAGFCGEETADGHLFDVMNEKWDDQLLQVETMRPRSVCVSGSFPSLGYAVIFGGEVDPSDRGHEGAGGFEQDLVILNEMDGSFVASLGSDGVSPWPPARGWSDAATVDDGTSTTSRLYIFGGLAGDDQNPQRLDDLWMLQIQK